MIIIIYNYNYGILYVIVMRIVRKCNDCLSAQIIDTQESCVQYVYVALISIISYNYSVLIMNIHHQHVDGTTVLLCFHVSSSVDLYNTCNKYERLCKTERYHWQDNDFIIRCGPLVDQDDFNYYAKHCTNYDKKYSNANSLSHVGHIVAQQWKKEVVQKRGK